ncbi:MAG: hypothetical protein U9N77_13950 [Thermodesulfobacteriota bacterium]|nr:hypothetical protein [Thermodesulfobacteriota bacterium]
MLSPGVLIAIDVTILYAVMGPLVLFGLYVVFDALGRKKDTSGERIEVYSQGRGPGADKKDPALVVDEDILL